MCRNYSTVYLVLSATPVKLASICEDSGLSKCPAQRMTSSISVYRHWVTDFLVDSDGVQSVSTTYSCNGPQHLREMQPRFLAGIVGGTEG